MLIHWASLDFRDLLTITKKKRNYRKKYQDNLITLGYKVETKVGYGTAATAIVQIINSQSFDLLVMGAHGHRNIKDILFGTTVNKVRHQVKIPVLIIN